MLCGISTLFRILFPAERQVTHALLTRPPLSHRSPWRISVPDASFDLHVLGTPPAFVLSQDQTLKTIVSKSLATFKSSFEHFLWLYLRFRISFLSVLSLCNVFKKYNLLKVITGMMSFFIIALFNFQDPLSIFNEISFVQRLDYYITLFLVCQEFF